MSYMLGQETRSKAASPAIIDHFINSWGGWPWQTHDINF